MSAWSQAQRAAVTEFLGTVQPNNPAILVKNIEDMMPSKWRGAFERLFALIEGEAGRRARAEWCERTAPREAILSDLLELVSQRLRQQLVRGRRVHD